MRVLLLPGMDGTGFQLDAFRAALPPACPVTVVRYGDAITLDELRRCVVVPDEPFAIVAESFGGALGMELARESPPQLRALVLVSSFLRPPHSPSPGLVSLLGPLLFSHSPPAWALRALLLGRDASEDEVARLTALLRTVPARVLTGRLRQVQARDVTSSFLECRIPMFLVTGRQDRVIPGRVARDLVGLRPDVGHLVVDGPHFLLQQRAEICARLIAGVLRAAA